MSKTRKPQRRTFRYWLQQLHLWIGLILLLPLVMMGITGAVLVYAHDIEHLLGQGDAPARTAGDWRTPAELIEAARAASNDPSRIPIAVRWPATPGEPAAVRLSRPGMANERPQFRGGEQGAQAQGRVPTQSPFAGSLQVLIDPVSLNILATEQAMTGWVRFFHDLHGHLFIAGGLGRELVGWLGVALLVLGCSGLYLWWPRSSQGPGQWKAAFIGAAHRQGPALQSRAARRGRHLEPAAVHAGEFHRRLSGLSAADHGSGQRGMAGPRHARGEVPGAGRAGPQPVPIGVDEAVALALARVPDARFLNAFLAARPEQALRIGMVARVTAKRADRHGDGRSFAPSSSRPRSRDHDIGEAISPGIAPDYGVGLGGAYKFLVFVSGIVMPALPSLVS